jgi:hypothetical protein
LHQPILKAKAMAQFGSLPEVEASLQNFFDPKALEHLELQHD